MAGRFFTARHTRRLIARLSYVLAALAMSTLPQSAAMAAPDSKASAPELLDEVVVSANHLWQIRKAIVEAENRFYSRYNELNTDNDFDVHCASAASLGTSIQRRRCEIVFYQDALMIEANAFLTGGYAPPAQLVLLERINDYRSNALKVINSDLQLRKLIRQRENLAKLYDKRRKEIFKDRWIDW